MGGVIKAVTRLSRAPLCDESHEIGVVEQSCPHLLALFVSGGHDKFESWNKGHAIRAESLLYRR